MLNVKIAWYRAFQAVVNQIAKTLPWRKSEILEGGAGSILRIPALLAAQGLNKPLVVTDQGLIHTKIALKLLTVLDAASIPYAIYDQTKQNPTIAMVQAISDLYVQENCDALLAIGGGSVIDAAKGAGVLIVRPNADIRRMEGLLKVRKKLPPLIVVPTTAGTGSETTCAALLTDQDTHHKYAIIDLCLIPHYAVLDPELTLGLPPAITAATGMDALTHAVEAYLCWTYNTQESIQTAEEAVALIFRNLEKAYKNGNDLEARNNMLLAAYKAGFAFTRAGVGNIHAIAHTLGGLYNTPHGLANAVIMPVVLEDYGTKAHKKLAKLAECAGIASPGASAAHNADLFIGEIYAMNERMGIPTGFDFIREQDIDQIIAWADAECNPQYPVPVVYDKTRYRRIIERIRIKTYSIGETCVGCTACVKQCPVNAISGERKHRHIINKIRCMSCGVCGRVCPSSAIFDENGSLCVALPKAKWKQPIIRQELCTACGLCVMVCTLGALEISLPMFQGDIQVHAILQNPKKCVSCGLCARECPMHAISLENTHD